MAPAADAVVELSACEARETAGGGLWDWLFGVSFGGSGQTAGGGGGASY